LREKEGGSCTIVAAGVVVRNVIAVDEVADTVEISDHLFRTSLVCLLMRNLVGAVRGDALHIGNAARQALLVFPLFLVSFRGSAVESGIWIWLRACVCGKHFLCRNAAIGTEAERRRKGCKENRKESEKVVKGFYTRRTPGEIVMIVSAFC